MEISSEQTENRGTLILEEIKGDLFSSSDEFSLCHCVSKDLKMGKGIAKIFKNLFGVSDLLSQSPEIGKTLFLRHNSRYIYYLITKDKFYNKPTLESLKEALLDLKCNIINHKVKKLAMPRIGCGLDKLNWVDVKNLLIEVFNNVSIHIIIYYLK